MSMKLWRRMFCEIWRHPYNSTECLQFHDSCDDDNPKRILVILWKLWIIDPTILLDSTYSWNVRMRIFHNWLIRAREFDVWFGVWAPARILSVCPSEKTFGHGRGKTSGTSWIMTAFSLAIWRTRKKHFGDGREKNIHRFRTVSSLQNLVRASDAKPQIKFACPKESLPKSLRDP